MEGRGTDENIKKTLKAEVRKMNEMKKTGKARKEEWRLD